MLVGIWENTDIVKLLVVYKRYEYTNTIKRQTAFKILIEEMRDRAFQDISLEMLVKIYEINRNKQINEN
jgi:hypothetical protein